MDMMGAQFRVMDQAMVALESKRWKRPQDSQQERDWLRMAIKQGQRFYLPGDVQIIDPHTGPCADCLCESSPYPLLTVLTEIGMDDAPDKPWPCIAGATVVDGEAHVAGIFRNPSGWQITPIFRIHGSAQKAEYIRTPFAFHVLDHFGMDNFLNLLAINVNRLANLCRLLALSNVQTHQMDAPGKVNRSRERRGKRPLYSYHVLDVAGDRWASLQRSESNGTGAGVRSHLRRGHIRRLDAARSVWVRETFVHGSAPGFVAKDYNTKPLARAVAEG